MIVSLDIIYLSGAILSLEQFNGDPNLPLYMLQCAMWIICGICGFLFTFEPILLNIVAFYNHNKSYSIADIKICNNSNTRNEKDSLPRQLTKLIGWTLVYDNDWIIDINVSDFLSNNFHNWYLEKKFVGDKFSIFEEFEGVYYSKHNSSISFNNYHHNSKHNSINVMRNSHISHNSYNAMRSSYNSAINIVTSNNNSINGCDIVEKKVIEKG
ncbi:7141_t:CDS:2 [Entrophospora sp. SA101]|nr:7141_t:CDS:2 [Entrophospora sp. SA101]